MPTDESRIYDWLKQLVKSLYPMIFNSFGQALNINEMNILKAIRDGIDEYIEESTIKVTELNDDNATAENTENTSVSARAE